MLDGNNATAQVTAAFSRVLVPSQPIDIRTRWSHADLVFILVPRGLTLSQH